MELALAEPVLREAALPHLGLERGLGLRVPAECEEHPHLRVRSASSACALH